MLKIAVCDDEDSVKNTLCAYITKLCAKLGERGDIHAFGSGESLLMHYPRGLDLIFLDIQLGGMDGIETARMIRKSDERVSIVFMTNYTAYAVEGYTVGAYRYLLKPVEYPVFEKELFPLFERLCHENARPLALHTPDGYVSLNIPDILYVETGASNSVAIHTLSREISVYSSMRAMEEILGKYYFFRCHNSFMVNLGHVREIGKNTVTLSRGICVPVSKHRRKIFMEAFASFVGGVI